MSGDGRVERLGASLEEPLLVTNPANLRYLTGFDSSNAALLVARDGVRLFADFRYAVAGRAVPGVEFVETERALFAGLARHLSGRIAFESDHLTYASYEMLHAAGIELVARSGLVEALRAVKEEAELETIRRAAAITSEAFAGFSRERFVGRTERELTWRMEELLHELGAQGTAFPTIVAAGATGSTPHARGGDREVEAGATVVVDAGAILDGYCSDCTRTFATGPLPDTLKEAYTVCLGAQLAALDAVRPGAVGREVDAVARDRIAEAGFGEAFGHGLGHGVGVVVQEEPRLTQTSEQVLEPGNVVTVEPGIYLEGLGGIRIEDLVVVRDGEPEILTSFAKDLVSVE
ncbi:MAG TPA: Xaa-Pro peptidase family protein [Gaiellaceae bacterium]